jgi:alpha-1,6-mannosyltransferase
MALAPGRVVLACGATLTACVAFWAAQGDQTWDVRRHLAVYAVAFAAYVVATRAGERLQGRALGAALLAAMAWRAILVASPPLLSDDVYRAVWEGRIQNHGGNPYEWMDRPEADRWIFLRDDVWDGVNHKFYTAIYPPLWQLAARLVAAVSDTIWAMKAFLAGCEVLCLFLLAHALRREGAPPGRLLILAWSPLALVEVAGSGHNEPFGALFLVAALILVQHGSGLAAAVAAALGAQAKILPGLVALAWLRRFRPWHVLVAAVVAALLVAPYAAAGAGLLDSLTKFSRYWRFNDTVFALLAAVAPTYDLAVGAATILLAALAVGLGVAGANPVPSALAVVAGSLILSPNVLPWYALWLVPLLVLRPDPGLLLFTGTVQLAYLVYPVWMAGARWHLGWDVRAIEYLPCVALSLWSWRRGRG